MNTARSDAHYKRIRIIWPILLMIILFSGSSGSAPAVPGLLQFAHVDKIAHFFVFGLVATAVYRAIPASVKVSRRAVIAVVLVSIFGIFDEMRQGFNPERTMDHLDWLADTSGAFLAVFVYVKWPFYRNLLETEFTFSNRRHGNRSSSPTNSEPAPVSRPAR